MALRHDGGTLFAWNDALVERATRSDAKHRKTTYREVRNAQGGVNTGLAWWSSSVCLLIHHLQRFANSHTLTMWDEEPLVGHTLVVCSYEDALSRCAVFDFVVYADGRRACFHHALAAEWTTRRMKATFERCFTVPVLVRVAFSHLVCRIDAPTLPKSLDRLNGTCHKQLLESSSSFPLQRMEPIRACPPRSSSLLLPSVPLRVAHRGGTRWRGS